MPTTAAEHRLRVAALVGRTTWNVLVTVLVGVGAASAMLTLDRGAVVATCLTTWVVVGLNGGIVAYAFGFELRPTVLPSIVLAVVSPCLVGTALLLGPWALMPWVAAVLTSPTAVSLVIAARARRRSYADPPGLRRLARTQPWSTVEADDALDLPSTPAELDSATVRQLGRVWVDSARELAGAQDPASWARIVALRTACLDVLERRDPTGFRSWVAVGDVLGSPETHVREGRGTGADPGRGSCDP